MRSNEYQDSLLESIERTYRTARTDAATGEVLPVDVALKQLIEKVCTLFDIPEATLYTDDPVEWARILAGGEIEQENPTEQGA
jgi:hypothetical protein